MHNKRGIMGSAKRGLPPTAVIERRSLENYRTIFFQAQARNELLMNYCSALILWTICACLDWSSASATGKGTTNVCLDRPGVDSICSTFVFVKVTANTKQ